MQNSSWTHYHAGLPWKIIIESSYWDFCDTCVRHRSGFLCKNFHFPGWILPEAEAYYYRKKPSLEIFQCQGSAQQFYQQCPHCSGVLSLQGVEITSRRAGAKLQWAVWITTILLIYFWNHMCLRGNIKTTSKLRQKEKYYCVFKVPQEAAPQL